MKNFAENQTVFFEKIMGFLFTLHKKYIIINQCMSYMGKESNDCDQTQE